MPLSLQARLLRVLAEGEYYRVGGRELLKSDVRVLAATHQDLRGKVDRASFAPIFCIDSTWFVSTYRRCVSVWPIFPGWPIVF